MERQESMSAEASDYCNLLAFLLNACVVPQHEADATQVLGKRKHREDEEEVQLEDLVEVLGRIRVYLRVEYAYCIKCKIDALQEHPCKHSR